MAINSFEQLKKKFRDINIDYVLKTYGFQDEVIEEWNSIKEDIDARGVSLVEFKAPSHENNHWALIITSNKGSSKRSQKYFNKQANTDLKQFFIRRMKNEQVEELFSRIDLTGLYIPLNNIKEVEPNTLKSHLTFSSQLIKHFPYQEYFTQLIKTAESLNVAEDFAPYAIWNYIIYYAKFLRRFKDDNYGLYEIYGKWFSELLDLDDFHRRLPSEQISILLLITVEALISNTNYYGSNKNFLSKACDEVSTFFNQYESELNLLFDEEGLESETQNIKVIQDKLQEEFVRIVLLDEDDLLVQEILDNRNKLNLSLMLPAITQIKYGLKSIYHATLIVKDKVFNDEKSAGEFKEDDKSQPNYRREKQKIYPITFQYWFDLLPKEKEQLLSGIRKNAASVTLDKASQAVEWRRRVHLLNLINLLSSPVLNWTIEEGKFFPQWNLFEDDMAKSLLKLYLKKIEDQEKEKEILEAHLKQIFEFNSIEELTDYVKRSHIIFSNRKFQLRWNHELERISRIIRNRERFYESRMDEFGISESKLNTRQKQKWVEEMMAIEDEIKPYIKFVKQAFQTALPIRKKMNFSEERHKSDGVEFDPDTLFDHEKWIRADVMKVMESKIERGDAIQINTFCLDYSGSMNHDRMRNLFKMLYLLVIGLEDRKSYDAFHFFSDEFIEVVDFSSEFTNRKVLFQILQQIAQLHIGKVIYFGEGGTNMSAGIKISHEKMLKFVDEFKANNPEANIVTSIFVITDGEPSLGITNIPKLNAFIEERRLQGDVEIKGIFIKSEDDVSLELMEEIFGTEHFVETTDFQEGVNKFVKIMTETYKKQRKSYKWKQKRKKLGLTD